MSTDAKSRFRFESLGPGKNRLMPDIYAEEFTVEEPTLEEIDKPAAEFEETGGFDPYDTATLYKK